MKPTLTQNTIMEEDPTATAERKKNPRRYSLVHQASCETQHHIGVRRQNTIQHRKQLNDQMRGQKIFQQLNDEGIELIFAANEGCIEFSVIMSSTDTLPNFFTDIINSLKSANVQIAHIESRPGKVAGLDVLADCRATKRELIEAASFLTKLHNSLTAFSVFKKKSNEVEVWFPRHISDLDRCSKCITKYEPTTDPRHPGHGDEEYIARRKFLNDQALEFQFGDEIENVDYTETEHATWKAVYEKLGDLHESHTCSVYRDNLKVLQEEGVLTSDRIPQMRDVNKFLQKRTGFELRPCSGLLSARDFLASLAFRVFQTTTYLRHHKSPHHSPEPDLIHELLGHVPMFSDPLLAQMSQDIGLMSLGASDENIEKLATVYWFIVEFGLCKEDGKLKAIGAGLLSAYGELIHACSNTPEHRDFDPVVTAVQKYEDDDYQPLYFVADSIHDALAKLRKYASTMDRPFSVIYDPFTKSIETIKSSVDLEKAFSRLSNDLSAITRAADRMKIITSA
uniref:BH4_AAA_HYDROXYL_2 domain-containing protein n=2 Tax=Caenorhabditis japonica TaxID=281687 RepID=A0A8R1DYK7_CAEJA